MDNISLFFFTLGKVDSSAKFVVVVVVVVVVDSLLKRNGCFM